MFYFVNHFFDSLFKKIKINFYIYKSVKKLHKDYKFRFLSQYPEYKSQLKDLCFSITQGHDPKAVNYSKNRFPIESQLDILLLIHKEKILAFSSLWQSSFYPKNCVRVLNRTWRDPSIRNLIQKKIMIVLLLYQIKLALKNKKIDTLFTSMEGMRLKWWTRWTNEVNQIYPGWKIYPKMIKVCEGSYLNCWQSCVYLNLFNKNNSILLFPSLEYKKWKNFIKKEKV